MLILNSGVFLSVAPKIGEIEFYRIFLTKIEYSEVKYSIQLDWGFSEVAVSLDYISLSNSDIILFITKDNIFYIIKLNLVTLIVHYVAKIEEQADEIDDIMATVDEQNRMIYFHYDKAYGSELNIDIIYQMDYSSKISKKQLRSFQY